jgi:hypothetical protein
MESSRSPRAWCGIEEFPTDIHWQLGGGAHNTDVHFNELSWDASTWDWSWNFFYEGIRDANIVLENVDIVEGISEDTRELIRLEARFVRAYTYFQLYQRFGPVPLRTSTTQEAEQPRASEQELLDFIETEMLACRADLPEPGNEAQYGRGHKAAARAYLCDLYMTTKRWQDAADMAQEIISMGKYDLYPVYGDLFKAENERNNEYIWIRVAKAHVNRIHDCEFVNVCFPRDFQKDPDTGLEWNDSWVSFAANYKLRDNFVYSFHEDDIRAGPSICERYLNKNGDTINALGNDDARSFKFWPDPEAISRSHGNDHPVYRYAEILLFRAEALNELNGPNQESVDLINQVRQRAGVPELALGDFSNKEQLRDHILDERGWEFYNEGKRRHHMIRMGKFVESAIERGYTHVQAYREVYPIPQFAMDANKKLVQNDGY